MAERISLVEAYNNRDVVAQLVRLRNDVNEILAILEDIDPQGDLTNFVTKTGDEVISGIKTFTGKIVADCDIIQNGAAYETHAEQVYSTKDYIRMRDGAIAALAPGDLSGIEVENYDGLATNCRLAVDASGVARVGDSGDEQPLATRDEVADMTSGALVKWDGVNMKMIAPASNVGDETHPVKIVSGEPVALTDPLVMNKVYTKSATTSVPSGTITDLASTVTVLEAGTYLFVGQGELSTNPSTTQTYSVQMNVNGVNTNLFMGNYSTDSYARYTVSSVVTVAANSTIGLAIYQNLGTAVSCPSTVFAVRLV